MLLKEVKPGASIHSVMNILDAIRVSSYGDNIQLR